MLVRSRQTKIAYQGEQPQVVKAVTRVSGSQWWRATKSHWKRPRLELMELMELIELIDLITIIISCHSGLDEKNHEFIHYHTIMYKIMCTGNSNNKKQVSNVFQLIHGHSGLWPLGY